MSDISEEFEQHRFFQSLDNSFSISLGHDFNIVDGCISDISEESEQHRFLQFLVNSFSMVFKHFNNPDGFMSDSPIRHGCNINDISGESERDNV
ncbi:hypothetical protein KY289_023154 [Solanum tuberosum]|nr:hypothetical protein KY289_023154 [Solanum tuberosum]